VGPVGLGWLGPAPRGQPVNGHEPGVRVRNASNRARDFEQVRRVVGNAQRDGLQEIELVHVEAEAERRAGHDPGHVGEGVGERAGEGRDRQGFVHGGSVACQHARMVC
jgi:hypothetical protein